MIAFRTRSGDLVHADADYNLGAITRHYLSNPGEVYSPPGFQELTDAFTDDVDVKRVRSGVAVPVVALGARRRSLSLANSGSFVSTKLPPVGDFTEVMRAKSVVGLLGGRFKSYFSGSEPVSITKKTSATAVGWIADGTPAPEGSFEVASDGASGASQTLAATLLVPRKLWISTADDDVHDYIINDLTVGFAAEVDRAVVAGAGGLEPIGLLNLAGVPSGAFGANGGAPSRAALVAAMRAVGNANGESSATASMGWLTSPDGEAKLRLTDGQSGGAGAWLWDDRERVVGKPAASTTSVPNDLTKGSGTGLTALAYGNWGDVLVNHAKAVQISVDPRTYLDGGMVRISAFLDVKILFRNSASFYVFKDMSTA